MFRQFLYLDAALVREFLAQAEGGIYDEARELSVSESKRGGSARAGTAAFGGGLERSKSAQSETEAVVRQTAASEFNRLYDKINEAGLAVFDAIDAPVETLPIARKDIIEVDARLRISGLKKMLDLFGSFGRLLPVMEQFGAKADVDPQMTEMAGALDSLNDGAPLPVIGTVPGECGLKIAMDLLPAAVQASSIDGEATVLLKVQRILRKGDHEVVGDPFGGLMSMIPPPDRDELLKSLQSPEAKSFGIGEMTIEYPALVGTAIAIYR